MQSAHKHTSEKISLEYAAQLRGFYQNQIATHPVYANNYSQLRVTALCQHYPATRKLLGDQVFYALCSAYAQHYQRRGDQWDINLYGEQFFDLIAAQERSQRAVEHNWTLLSWLAGLEYRLLELYYAESPQLRNARGLQLNNAEGFHLKNAEGSQLKNAEGSLFENVEDSQLKTAESSQLKNAECSQTDMDQIRYPLLEVLDTNLIIKAIKTIDQCHPWLSLDESSFNCIETKENRYANTRAIVACRKLNSAGFSCVLSLKSLGMDNTLA